MIKEEISNTPSFVQWLEPSFPFNFMLDLINYSLLLFVFYLFWKYRTNLSYRSFLLFSILLAAPFFVNGFLITWHTFPDQSKYVAVSRIIRENLLYPFDIYSILLQSHVKINFASFIYNFFPSTNFETYKSIGFINRFLFLIMFIFLLDRKYLSISCKLFLILSPSLIFYSSISLREIMVLVSMVFLFYYLIKKKYLFSIFLTLILYFIKPQNLLIVYFAFCLHLIFFNKKYLFLNLFLITAFISLVVYNFDYLLSLADDIRRGFYSEQYGNYQSKLTEDFYSPLSRSNYIHQTFDGIQKMIMSPFPNIDSYFNLLIFLENILIYIIIYFYLFKKFNEKNINEIKVSLIWITTLIFAVCLYSLISYNDGTIHRYKIIILSFIIISFNIHNTEKKNQQFKNNLIKSTN